MSGTGGLRAVERAERHIVAYMANVKTTLGEHGPARPNALRAAFLKQLIQHLVDDLETLSREAGDGEDG